MQLTYWFLLEYLSENKYTSLSIDFLTQKRVPVGQDECDELSSHEKKSAYTHTITYSCRGPNNLKIHKYDVIMGYVCLHFFAFGYL